MLKVLIILAVESFFVLQLYFPYDDIVSAIMNDIIKLLHFFLNICC